VPGMVSGATLHSICPLAGGLGEIQRAGYRAVPIFAPGHWCVRLYYRTATDALGKALPILFSRCGRAGKGRCTGFGDVSPDSHLPGGQVLSQVSLVAFPLAGPDPMVSFLRRFHPERWRCLMETR